MAVALATPTASGMLLNVHRAHEVDAGLAQRLDLDTALAAQLLMRSPNSSGCGTARRLS